MKEWPLLYSAPMVRSTLAGRKTVTRRLDMRLLKAQPGDVLWGRETFYDDHGLRQKDAKPTAPDEYIEYRATHDCRNWEAGCPCRDENGRSGWRPSIFMPRWASRIVTPVVSVRAEQLQDITEEDARAEGLTFDLQKELKLGTSWWRSLREGYEALWDHLNGARAPWSSNPTVVRIEFKPLEARR